MQSLLLIQCILFYLFNAIFLIDLMQSCSLLSNAVFLYVESNRFLFMQCNVLYLFNVMFFINAIQSTFTWLLRLNSKARGEHLTI